MITNPFFLISILISAVLTFFTTAFMIELALGFLRINNQRAKASIRVFAFASLLLELSLHSFGKYNVLNPLSCFSCIQDLILLTFFPELKAFLTSHEISLVNYLAIDSYHAVFATLFIGWVLITVFTTLRGILKIYWMRIWLQTLIQSSRRCQRDIQNTELLKALTAAKVKIFVNQEVTVPLATYTREIVISEYLIEKLSQKEFESIIAHELEHIKTGDPITRLFIDGLSALFWWVPTNWYRQKIERDQEMACDKSVIYYGFNSSTFASALIKASKWTNEVKQELVCNLTGKKKSIISRLQVVLGINAPPKESILLAGVIVGVEVIILIMCMTML